MLAPKGVVVLLLVLAEQEEELSAALARGEEPDECGTFEWMSDLLCTASNKLPGFGWSIPGVEEEAQFFLRSILPHLPVTSRYVS